MFFFKLTAMISVINKSLQSQWKSIRYIYRWLLTDTRIRLKRGIGGNYIRLLSGTIDS